MAMMRIFAHRKGVFMTIMAIIVMIFLFSYTEIIFPKETQGTSELTSDRTRIVVMNNYISVFESYTAASARAAGYIALQNLSDQIRDKGVMINNTQQLNAWVYDCMWSHPEKCMNRSQSLNASLYALGGMVDSTMNIITTYDVTNITIEDSAPFEVKLVSNISDNISDNAGVQNFARWNTSTVIYATIDMTGVDDPLYMYGYQNRTFINRTHPFNPTAIKFTSLRSTNASGALTNDINGNFTRIFYPRRMYTAAKSKGPSVIQRYTRNWSSTAIENSTSSNCCGIESIVHWADLNGTMFNISGTGVLDAEGKRKLENLSLIDYQFLSKKRFNCSLGIGYGGIAGLNTTFDYPYARIDAERLYNAYNYKNYTRYDLFFNATCLSKT